MTKDNKAYCAAYLDKAVHRALVSLASKLGMDITDVAAELIEEGIESRISMTAGTSDIITPELLLAETYLKMRRHEQSRTQLISLMVNFLQFPSEDKQLDHIQHLCEMCGFDMEDIRVQAQDLTHVQTNGVFSMSDAGLQTERALKLLNELFSGAPSIPYREIEQKAAQQDIPFNVLKVAKRQLGLISRRVKEGWNWELAYIKAVKSVEVKI